MSVTDTGEMISEARRILDCRAPSPFWARYYLRRSFPGAKDDELRDALDKAAAELLGREDDRRRKARLVWDAASRISAMPRDPHDVAEESIVWDLEEFVWEALDDSLNPDRPADLVNHLRRSRDDVTDQLLYAALCSVAETLCGRADLDAEAAERGARAAEGLRRGGAA